MRRNKADQIIRVRWRGRNSSGGRITGDNPLNYDSFLQVAWLVGEEKGKVGEGFVGYLN